jgi:DNA-binding NarL/FixJ family response regulator
LAGDAGMKPSLQMNYKILIVDNHPLFRATLKGAIVAAGTNCEFFEADSVAGLLDTLEQHPHTDLLMLDLNLPGAHGFCILAHLRGSHPELPVIVVSAMDDLRTVRRTLAFGAQGFLSKSADAGTIGRNVTSVLHGKQVAPAGLRAAAAPEEESAELDLAQRLAQLTTRQFRVFGMLCSGRFNKQIAYELQITEGTVKAHMTAILRKLGAANRTQAVLLAARLLLDPREIKPPPEEIE